MKSSISRRDVLKFSGIGLGALAFSRYRLDDILESARSLAQFPQGERLGRVAVYPYFYSTDVKAQPNLLASTVRSVADDEVVVWNREVVGSSEYGWTNKRWVETPDGYIYSPFVQPVKNMANTPLAALPEGKAGFWAEVTVPYVDMQVELAPSPWIKETLQDGLIPRLYYSQIVWIDQIRPGDSGRMLYRFRDDFGHGYGPGDLLWGDGAGFRPLTAEDVAPIHPEVDPNIKRIRVESSAERQWMACYEGNTEVYFCRVSTGVKTEGADFTTPPGSHKTERKFLALHMGSNSAASGFDTPAVSWTTLFSYNTGAAIHAAFWHNLFGDRRSHGCVNCLPGDAQWVFRWTLPTVSLDQGDLQEIGTVVDVNQMVV
jgi:hypothetical protein